MLPIDEVIPLEGSCRSSIIAYSGIVAVAFDITDSMEHFDDTAIERRAIRKG